MSVPDSSASSGNLSARDVVQVLIVGAGAAGLTLAIDLARRGVSFRLIERGAEPFAGSRGKGLQPRTIEVFEQLGMIDAFLAASAPYPPVANYGGAGGEVQVVRSEPERRTGEPYPQSLMIPQWRTEALLRARLAELGGRVEFGVEFIELVEVDGLVRARVTANGEEQAIACTWLVGTDGARSVVRKQLGIGYPGETGTFRMLIADLPIANLSDEAWHRWPKAPGGQFALCPLANTDSFQLSAELTTVEEPGQSREALQSLILARTGNASLIAGEPTWTSIYRVNFRLADAYRQGHVFIAGDAAHAHPPTGGQGLNTSVQDSFNLGWKLAAVVAGADERLLDTYEMERREIGAGVLAMSKVLLSAMAEKADMRRGRDTLQLDLNYRESPLSEEHRTEACGIRAGDRAPDATLWAPDGAPTRIFDLLRHPAFTLLAVGGRGQLGLRTEASVRLVEIDRGPGAYVDETGMFRDNYGLTGDSLLLIRPDGYIALAADARRTDLVEDWFRRWIEPARIVA
ncbi:FAD-dependent monooxygenase [Sphingomonas sp. QA11]|uniref:FAD-dependent monooxygenase n=1 Tax=Sphingomonas sp. QA11 TaxID=2950605 RepID=UPI0023496DDC|nr:FAD-dependent monooxygenase [Sphingomonas sp. QA11]WCM28591.1 FAD-dependent monooxygenase [Sphingomonas sp. QA11]